MATLRVQSTAPTTEASTSRASGGAGPSRAVTKGGKDRWLERAVVSAKETNLLRLCNRA